VPNNRPAAPDVHVARRSGASTVLQVLGAILVLGAVGLVASCFGFLFIVGYFSHDFIVRNDSGEELRNIVLLEEYRWREGAPSHTIGRIDVLAPGETATVEFERTRAFGLGVRFDGAGGPHALEDLCYIDGDEWGDRTISLTLPVGETELPAVDDRSSDTPK
jgi:hypothetical protein